MDNEIIAPNGEKLNLFELTDELKDTKDIDKQKELIPTLAWGTNEYVPCVDIYIGITQNFINDGDNVTGWPEGEELIAFLTSNPTFMGVVKLMVDGRLKCVK